MRCHDALEAMLTCEPEVLRGAGDGELSNHLRSCARCAAVGATLTGATALAAVGGPVVINGARSTAPGRPWARRSRVWTLAALPIAATLVAILMRRGSVEIAPPQANRVANVPGVNSMPAAPSESPAAPPDTSRRSSTRPLPYSAPSVAASPAREPFASNDDVHEGTGEETGPREPLVAPAAEPLVASVQVNNTGDKRAAIIKTTDPKITIVWLY